MHAPYADMSGPRQTNSSGGSLLNLSTWSETATIKKVSKDTTANPLGVIDNSTGYLLLIDTNPATNANEGVAYPYYTDKVGTAATDSSLNDGVEIILTSGGEYDAKTDLVPDLFRGAFVDLVVNGAGRNPQPTVPHTSKLDGSALPATRATQYGSKWSDSESRSPNLRQRRANYQHVIIGSRTSESEEMGLTENEAEGWNESFVARFTIDKRIDEANSLTSIPPGTDKYKFSEEIVAHELTHQWFTNLNNPGRHCFGKFTYSNSTEWCLMAFSGSGGPGTGNLFPDAQRTNLFMALHYVPGNDAIPADSEYITIRAAADPLQ